MSILRDGFLEINSNPLEPPCDVDSLALDWEGDMLDDVLADLAGPAAPREPQLPFCEWIAVQASWLRSQGTPAADWAAAEWDRLARLARFMGAASPAEFEGRRADDDALALADCYQRGFEAGLRMGRAAGGSYPFGHLD